VAGKGKAVDRAYGKAKTRTQKTVRDGEVFAVGKLGYRKFFRVGKRDLT
jgi:hypothetical protein